jgi:hypothetical protein
MKGMRMELRNRFGPGIVLAAVVGILGTSSTGTADSPAARSLGARASATAGDAVITRLSIPFFSGSLSARFTATPTGDGWNIDVEDYPRGVHFEFVERFTLHGTGTGSVTTTAGIPTDILLAGHFWQSRGGVRNPATGLIITVFIDANGVVSIP